MQAINKRRTIFLLTFVLIFCVTALSSRPSFSQTFFKLAPDPAGGGAGIGGFSTNLWISSTNTMLSAFGQGPVTGDNSIRAYDPVSNTWEYLWPNGHANGGVQIRDNHASFYVPKLDEYWVWGGSHLEEYARLTGNPNAQALVSGRFSIKQRKWVKTSTTMGGAFADVIAGTVPYNGTNPALAWSAILDMGIMIGGSSQGNPNQQMWIFEPNPAGPQPYKVSEFTGTRPKGISQAQNLLVAAGSDFYLFGGFMYSVDGKWVFTDEFWKFDGIKRVWSQLPKPPAVWYQSVVTYDSDKRLVVAWVRDRLYAYNIDENQWSDMTPAGLQCVFNQMGVYSPTAKMHIYEGGNRCSDASSTFMMAAIRLSGSSSALPPAPPADTSAPSVPTGLSVTPISTSQVNLSWNGSTDNVGVAGYKIFRNGTEITSVTATSYQNTGLSQATIYSYTVAAYDAAGNTSGVSSPASATTLPSAIPSTSKLDIPHRTWIARAFNTPNAPAAGFGGSGGGAKHLRIAENPNNGKLYFLGGDYQSSVISWFGIWTYDLPSNKWELDYPYCGRAGEIMPGGVDEAGWVWDSKRNVFWLFPGYVVLSNTPLGANLPCQNGPGTQKNSVLTYDPSAKKWMDPGALPEPTQPLTVQKSKNAVYDPITDSFFRAGADTRGLIWTRYFPARNTWEVYETSSDSSGAYINNVDLGFEYIAIDVIGRKIYAVDPFFYRLFSFDINTKKVSIKAPIPEVEPERVKLARETLQKPYVWQDYTIPVFDSINRVLLYPYIRNLAYSPVNLLIYRPDTDTWETDSMYQPERRTVRGNGSAFSSVHNALTVIGGLNAQGDIDPTNTHFFLYRYGGTNGTTPSPGTAPLAPSNLRLQ